jgi:hypothetical protein
VRHIREIGEMINTYRISIGEREIKRPTKNVCKRDDSIKMEYKEISWFQLDDN